MDMNSTANAITVAHTKGASAGRYNVILNGETVGWVVRSSNKWSCYRPTGSSADRIDWDARTRADSTEALIASFVDDLDNGITYEQFSAWVGY